MADVTRADEVSGYSSFTTTSQYVGYYVLYNDISTLVTSSNKDSVGITPGTTVAYHNIPTTRYSYQTTQWEFQFIINETAFTEAQLAAINSGITSELVAKMETTDNKVTTLSACSTDTEYPSAKCVYDIIGDVETLLTTLNSGGGVQPTPQPLPVEYFTYTSVSGGSEISGFSSAGDTAYDNGDITDLLLPSVDDQSNTIVSIGAAAFAGYDSLTSITIPSSVTSIGDSAFAKCSGLTSITIPNSVTSIGESVFSSCSGLTSITIPNSVTSIGNEAFDYCESLTSVTIGSGVTSIGSGAFQSCISLTSVTIEATTPPTSGTDVFYDTNNCPIYVPSASVVNYQSAANWSDYSARIQAIQ